MVHLLVFEHRTPKPEISCKLALVCYDSPIEHISQALSVLGGKMIKCVLDFVDFSVRSRLD